MLQVLRQSFFIGTAVKVMAVTSTTYGITTKLLVLGTASDQVSAACHSTCVQSQPAAEGTAAAAPQTNLTLHAAPHASIVSSGPMLACGMASSAEHMHCAGPLLHQINTSA